MPDDRSRATVQKPSSGLAPSQPRIGEREHPRKRALISPTSIKEPVTQIRSEGAAERFAPASASAGVAATCAAGAQSRRVHGDLSRQMHGVDRPASGSKFVDQRQQGIEKIDADVYRASSR